MKSNGELKDLALQDLRGKWEQPILTTLIYCAISGALSSIPFLGQVGHILLVLPLSYSFTQLFLRFIRGEKDNLVSKLFDCFNDYGKSLGTAFMVGLYSFLWSLLFIIPGIIKSLAYSMTFYIAKDHPEYSVDQCIEASMKMMDGHKMDLFLLRLSFIGWVLLSFLTLCIGLLWVIPYMQATEAHFYEQLRADQPSFEGQPAN